MRIEINGTIIPGVEVINFIENLVPCSLTDLSSAINADKYTLELRLNAGVDDTKESTISQAMLAFAPFMEDNSIQEIRIGSYVTRSYDKLFKIEYFQNGEIDASIFQPTISVIFYHMPKQTEEVGNNE